jgi:hypothetical protein
MSDKHPGGRPLLFTDVEELKQRIDAYFLEMDREEDTRVFEHEDSEIEDYQDIDEKTQLVVARKRIICPRCNRNPNQSRGCTLVQGDLKLKRPYTVSGLAVWLGCSRVTLLNYQSQDEFFATIKEAKDRIEAYSHECLYNKDVPTKGVTFSLSNNHEGWKEKTETDLNLKRDPAADLMTKVFGDEADTIAA